MEALALYRQGRYGDSLRLAQQQDSPKAISMALLALGRDGEAAEALEAWRPQGEVAAAERLALLGFLQARKGNLAAYRRLVLAAGRQASTPLVLYHLGLALPPADGVVALEAALKGFAGPVQEEAQLAYALAHTLRRLGDFPQALAWASRAVLLSPDHPYYRLQELTLLAYTAQEPLAQLWQALPPFLAHQARGVRIYALWLSLFLQGLEGSANEETLAALLREAGGLSYELPLLAMIYRRASRTSGLARLLRAGRTWVQAPLSQALLDLAEGLYYFPQEEALPLLASALPLLRRELAEEALRAEAHLAFLEGRPLAEPYRTWAYSLRPEARLLFLPQELPGPTTPYLQVLGRARLEGLPPLRPRGYEILALLMAQPEGLWGSHLAEALYGQEQTGLEALKTEVFRLRQLGLSIASRPYRLLTPLRTDFLELQGAVGKGDLRAALDLYCGPLLPRSQAPGIESLRCQLGEDLKQAVLAQGDPDLLYPLAQRLGEDLTVWEAVLQALPPHDPRYPLALAWVRRLRAEYR
jgi:hypothetical protein